MHAHNARKVPVWVFGLRRTEEVKAVFPQLFAFAVGGIAVAVAPVAGHGVGVLSVIVGVQAIALASLGH